ncbi:MAG TPA: methyltransferase [Polyangiaceae bacterium]|nr:methyltransferase [Polyangiaceae bacterium]
MHDSFSISGALSQVEQALMPVLDIIGQRVHDAHVPGWCEQRGWTEFLLGLREAELERCEAEGLAYALPSLSGAPETLSDLARRVLSVSALPVLEASLVRPAREDLRGVSLRKQRQLSTLLGALAKLAAPARRIVDVGAGSGHFARLSAQHFSRATLGLERDPQRVAHATRRAQKSAADEQRVTAQFAVIDASRETLRLLPGDLAIGLHACGELGDTLVQAVAECGADLALVSCCLQKIRSPERMPLSRAAHGFALRKDTLGLSNLTSQAVGVEASIEHTIVARQARYALRLLLLARGLPLTPGAEMQGVNRRQAHAGLAAIAERSLSVHGLAPASSAEIAAFEREAQQKFGIIRRLSLPRDMLARAIELSVILDRAARLEEAGLSVRVATIFERAVTPRNVSLFASRDGSRLPAVQSTAS